MYVEKNEMVSAFNPEYKHSMANCHLTTTPTLSLGDVEIVFGGSNFEKLLSAADVSPSLISKLLERKKLSREIEEMSSITKSSSFFPTDDDEPLEDLYSTIFSMAECIRDREDNEMDIQIFADNLKDKDYFDEVVNILDYFKPSLDKKLEKIAEKKSKEEEKVWFSNLYEFEKDGIVVSKELGLKITGVLYENLLKNTKAYVDAHGSYIVNRDLCLLQEKKAFQKNLLDFVSKGKHKELDHEIESDQAVLLDIVKDFATYYGFDRCY